MKTSTSFALERAALERAGGCSLLNRVCSSGGKLKRVLFESGRRIVEDVVESSHAETEVAIDGERQDGA